MSLAGRGGERGLRVRYSKAAGQDLRAIAEYTLGEWGAAQAALYLDALEQGCERLGASPMMGRSCEEIRPGLRRLEVRRHVVFYRVRSEEIVIPGAASTDAGEVA